jgi:hypothetical protein
MKILQLFKKSRIPSQAILLKPKLQKPRHRCPFYGFRYGGAPNIFMDSEGNQCALMMKSYSPCKMEFNAQTPDWNKCPFNNEKNREALENIKQFAMIFPEEFTPEEKSSWAGMPLKEWINYVMSDSVERP